MEVRSSHAIRIELLAERKKISDLRNRQTTLRQQHTAVTAQIRQHRQPGSKLATLVAELRDAEAVERGEHLPRPTWQRKPKGELELSFITSRVTPKMIFLRPINDAKEYGFSRETGAAKLGTIKARLNVKKTVTAWEARKK